MDVLKITPNKEKASSILKMVETSLAMIRSIDKYPSHVIREYYDIIRELLSVILLLDGYKPIGESAHKIQIEYIQKNYSEIKQSDISLMDELRVTRNKISYDGYFVPEDYVTRKSAQISRLIEQLQTIVRKKV